MVGAYRVAQIKEILDNVRVLLSGQHGHISLSVSRTASIEPA
jgi:hypothetical protein